MENLPASPRLRALIDEVTARPEAAPRAPDPAAPAGGLAPSPGGRPRLLPTLWHGSGILNALDDPSTEALLRLAQPDGVQVHSWNARLVAPRLRSILPDAQLVVGVGVDGIARDVARRAKSVAWGVAQFVALARMAEGLGARAIVWNAEADWKRPPDSAERARLVGLVGAALAEVASAVPALEQWHSAYDHPTFHATYPWEAWLGAGSPVVLSLAQVYAAPGDAVVAHRGALPAREARSLASWGRAVAAGWIRADAPEGTSADLRDVDWRPYYQLHHVMATDTVTSAVRHATAAFWALPTRSDAEGRRALVALGALSRLGYWGAGALRRFQEAHPAAGLADDRYGAQSERALLAAAGLDPALVARAVG